MERRTFAEDIPELHWEHDTPDRCTIVWGCKLPHGVRLATNDPDTAWQQVQCVRAGIQIGEARAAKRVRRLASILDKVCAGDEGDVLRDLADSLEGKTDGE